MICKIADLIVKIPTSGGLSPRCWEYRIETEQTPDVVIREEDYRLEKWPQAPYELTAYMESGWRFCLELLRFNGLCIHASAVEYEGNAYLFSGPSTVGKSTHTRLWQKVFGPSARILNDDKPALRSIDGTWYAYGTPWCGKDGINRNEKVPLAGICFLRQSQENRIRRLSAQEAVPLLLSQTIRSLQPEEAKQLLLIVGELLRTIPIYLLENVADEAAAQLSYRSMRPNAEKF